jgi:hypothetical protein
MVVLALGKQSPLDGLFQASGFQFFKGLKLIQTLYEKQISDLLDHFQRIGNSPGPERIRDLIYLVTNFVRQHDVCSLDCFRIAGNLRSEIRKGRLGLQMLSASAILIERRCVCQGFSAVLV